MPFSAFALLAVFWTENLNAQPTNAWSLKLIGSNGTQKKFVVSNDVVKIGGSAPTAQSGPSTAFVFQTLRGNGQIIARFAEMPKTPTQQGVMIRETWNTNSPFAWMSVADATVRFDRRIDASKNISSTSETNLAAPRWLRLVREGNAFSGFHSVEGTNWVQISADTIEMPQDVFVGLATTSHDEITFGNVQTTSARLISPPQDSILSLPTNLLIEAEVAGFNSQTRKVEFFAEATKIGEALHPPYSMIWSNALSGTHSISAKVTGDSQTEFFTEPVNCEFKLPPTSAKFVRIDSTSKGNWKNRFGGEGLLVVHHATNYPAYAAVSPRRHKSILLTHSGDPSALRLTNDNGGIIAQWFSPTNMLIEVAIRDGHPHQIALYCHDWDSHLRVQQIQVFDPVTRRLLDERRVADFHSGKYLIWNIRGTVAFRITAIAGNAVVSGIFFDKQQVEP